MEHAPMKLSVIINPLSRSVPKGAADEMEAAIRVSGHDLCALSCSADRLGESVRAAAASDADAVIAWGGDGTLACTLTACGMSGPPVLALPGGTMNMLPKRLYGDAPWHDILERALSKPDSRSIAAGEADQRRFYIAALFGRLTALAETREAVRKGELLDAAQALVEGEVLDVETRLRLSWKALPDHLHTGEHLLSAVAAAVALTKDGPPAFEVAAIDPDSTLDLMSTALDAMIHGWKQADPVEYGVSRSVTVHELGDAAIPATLDGEQVSFAGPVHIRMIEQAARVLYAEPGH
jgi:diacylglycerol kinase family enzyme